MLLKCHFPSLVSYSNRVFCTYYGKKVAFVFVVYNQRVEPATTTTPLIAN
jgi:hypothetical protein